MEKEDLHILQLMGEIDRLENHSQRELSKRLNMSSEMEKKKVRFILFCGAGEVAELAYLYLQLSSLRLVGIVDEKQQGRSFFGFRVASLERLQEDDWDMVLLTRLDDTERTIHTLLERGVGEE